MEVIVQINIPDVLARGKTYDAHWMGGCGPQIRSGCYNKGKINPAPTGIPTPIAQPITLYISFSY
jgi:hypothetical protein